MFNINKSSILLLIIATILSITTSYYINTSKPKNIGTYNGTPAEQHLWIRLCQKQMLDYIYEYNATFGRRLYLDIDYYMPFACEYYYLTAQNVKIKVYLQLCDLEWIVPIDTLFDCQTVTRPPKNTCNMTGEVVLQADIDNVYTSKVVVVDTGKCPVPEPPKCDVTSHAVSNYTESIGDGSVLRNRVDFYCDGKVLKYCQDYVTCKRNGRFLPPGSTSC